MPLEPTIVKRAPTRRALAALGVSLLVLAPPAMGAGKNETSLALDLPQLSLEVAELQIVPAFAPPPDRAHVESTVPFAPTAALEAWAKTHVAAKGKAGVALIVIRDASVTATKLKPNLDTIRDWFRRQPIERFDATLELELQIRDDDGRLRAMAITRATHARYLMDNWRDLERERIEHLQMLTDEIVAAALTQLEREARDKLARYVR